MRLIQILFILPFFGLSQELPELFVHNTNRTRIELKLNLDSTFTLAGNEANAGMVTFYGSFEYKADTLILTMKKFKRNTENDVFGQPLSWDPIFHFKYFIRKENELFLSIREEPELLGPLIKTNPNKK